MGKAPSEEPCSCGASAQHRIGAGVGATIRGFKPYFVDGLSLPPGWNRGNTDSQAYDARVDATVRAKKKQGLADKKAGIKGGMQFIGHVPLAIANMRRRQHGNDYWNHDIESKLRDEGLHVDQK